jgi:hypothetical protein
MFAEQLGCEPACSVKQSESWVTYGLGRTISKTGQDGKVGLGTYDLVFEIGSVHPNVR